MLGTGETMVVSSSLRQWFESLAVPGGWTKDDSVSFKALGVAQPWSYKRTAVAGALGITAGALTQASGGPKWSTAMGAGVGLLFDANAQLIRHMRERGMLRRWLGPTTGNRYSILRNGSGLDSIAISKTEKTVSASGKILLFERGSSTILGTEITVP